MKKYLFRCKECGHEFRLHAWRAVCPNCEKSYSLVKVVESAKSLRIRPRIFVCIFLLVYAVYSIITLNVVSAPSLTYFYLYQVFIIVAALFALSGSLPSNGLSVLLGGLIAYNHTANLSTNYDIIFIILGAAVAFLAVLDELIIRQNRKES